MVSDYITTLKQNNCNLAKNLQEIKQENQSLNSENQRLVQQVFHLSKIQYDLTEDSKHLRNIFEKAFKYLKKMETRITFRHNIHEKSILSTSSMLDTSNFNIASPKNIQRRRKSIGTNILSATYETISEEFNGIDKLRAQIINDSPNQIWSECDGKPIRNANTVNQTSRKHLKNISNTIEIPKEHQQTSTELNLNEKPYCCKSCVEVQDMEITCVIGTENIGSVLEFECNDVNGETYNSENLIRINPCIDSPDMKLTSVSNSENITPSSEKISSRKPLKNASNTIGTPKEHQLTSTESIVNEKPTCYRSKSPEKITTESIGASTTETSSSRKHLKNISNTIEIPKEHQQTSTELNLNEKPYCCKSKSREKNTTESIGTSSTETSSSRKHLKNISNTIEIPKEHQQTSTELNLNEKPHCYKSKSREKNTTESTGTSTTETSSCSSVRTRRSCYKKGYLREKSLRTKLRRPDKK